MEYSDDEIEDLVWELQQDDILKYLLLLIESNNRRYIQSKTAYVKELYLIAQNITDLLEQADFKPNLWGPNSDRVIDGITKLENYGLIEHIEERYHPTDLSQIIYDRIEETVSTRDKKLIEDMKELLDGLSTFEIFGIIYYNFPETTIESLERDRLQDNRVTIAISLHEKNKVSLEKAAEIAGLSFQDFIAVLRRRTKGD